MLGVAKCLEFKSPNQNLKLDGYILVISIVIFCSNYEMKILTILFVIMGAE